MDRIQPTGTGQGSCRLVPVSRENPTGAVTVTGRLLIGVSGKSDKVKHTWKLPTNKAA